MEITINGKAADITLDNEKTVGEIMSGMEQWLSSSGHRISGFSIDGKTADTSIIETFFSKDIDSIKTIDIYTNSMAELSLQSLVNLLADTKEYENLNFEDKNNFLETWKESAQALFAAEQMPDLHSLFVNTFSGSGINTGTLYSITEERLREVKDPDKEFVNLQPLLEETCARLKDFALDIQTGKDAEAARTIQIFSGVSEKLLRVLSQLDIQGYLPQAENGEKSFNSLIAEFGKVIKELHEAYEKKDTVLVGDIAEYEASSLLHELYTSIMKNSRQPSSEQVKNDSC